MACRDRRFRRGIAGAGNGTPAPEETPPQNRPKTGVETLRFFYKKMIDSLPFSVLQCPRQKETSVGVAAFRVFRCAELLTATGRKALRHIYGHPKVSKGVHFRRGSVPVGTDAFVVF